MQRLGDWFHGRADGGALAARLAEASVIGAWGEVVGGAIKENTRAYRIKNGILYVRTKSPSWSHELKTLEHQIRRRINERLGSDTVREIRFTHSGKLSKDESAPEECAPAPDISSVELSDDEIGYIEDIAGWVEEEELRERLVRLAIKDKKLKAWRARQDL